jgi:hypothetical protein
MIIDSTAIPLDDLKPNSLLVLRVDAGTQEQLQFDVQKVIAGLKQVKIPDGVKIMVMPSTTKLELAPEHVMNAAGWVRKP